MTSQTGLAEMITRYKLTTSECVHCHRPITLDKLWPAPHGRLGIWYHDDLVDVDCSGESCDVDDGEGNEAEPNDC